VRVALRTRLSLAFVFLVLLPVVVGSILVVVVAPSTLNDQVAGRLRTARTSVTDALAARCSQAAQAAQLLGLQVAALGPQAAVRSAVEQAGVGYAVVGDASGNVVASAGSLPAAPSSAGAHPLPATLDSCGGGAGAAFAISARAQVRIADLPTLRDVAVAWPVDTKTAAQLSGRLDGSPGVTLLAGKSVVSTDVAGDSAAKLAAAYASHEGAPGNLNATTKVGNWLAVFAPPGQGQPYGVVVSESAPATSKLTWLLVAVILFTIAAGLFIGRLLARLISRPVVELSEAAGRVAGGDLDIALPVRSRDEVGRLASAFNHMAAELRSYIGRLEQSRDELRRNVDRLGSTLAHTHDLGGILDVVLESAIGSVQATGGVIMFLDADHNLTVRARRGAVAAAMPADARVAIAKGITGQVASTGEPVRGTVGEGPGLRPDPAEPEARTVVAVPLKQSGRIVGVLSLYDKSPADVGAAHASTADVKPDSDLPREFTAHDLESLLTFAGQASVAIDNVLLHQEAQRLSLTDPLTALWNYRYLTLALGHEIERATRFGRPLAVLMLDLDRFKLINDRHGHQVGDAVLIELASRMRTQVREVDTLARYGGEEFVVVLPETDAEGAARTAERLGAVIRSSMFCEGTAHELPVTASVGVAVFPDHGVDASQLLRSADNALYDAKAAGRDCWRFASGEPVGDVPRPDPATSSEALLEAFDETSPIARSGDASSEHPSSEHPSSEHPSSEQPSSGQEAPPTPKVVVMPDVHVATRGEPRRPES
jgi:diguanylate cyclase (GGDEF)-like protein